MDVDGARLLDAFARECAAVADGGASGLFIERTQAALRTALTVADGKPDEIHWSRFYREASRLIAWLDDGVALPGLRAFLAENADLCDEEAHLVRL